MSDPAFEALAARLATDLRPVLELMQEEARFRRCYFLGVEHLFVALVKNPNGRLAKALETLGADPKPVRDAVRHFAGVGGGEVPFAPPTKPTPRLDAIVRAGSEAARARGEIGALEIDLVRALVADPDASPTVVLSRGGMEMDLLLRALQMTSAIPGLDRDKLPSSAFPRGSVLARFGRDVTALAAENKLAPVIGRDREIRQILRTLCRQTKNAPLLVGEPGVGKTAVVEGLAQRIVAKDVPPTLASRRLVEVSLGSLVAGTKYRGEFEERMEKLVQEARENPTVILFIDEIHTLVGAGGAGDGALDAGQILKPALARGEISVIGATTPAEFAKTIEKDGALSRRFAQVRIEEPDPEDTKRILEGRRDSLSRHHGMAIEADAIRAAVDLSVRYLPERKLPDKALDLLDESCARLRVRTVAADEGEVVTAELVAKVLAEQLGIPVAKLTDDDKSRLMALEQGLERRVKGQSAAIAAVSKKIRLARAGLRDPKKPTGVFLFLGPSGVGKTELAKALAENLMGSERDIVRIDMSEYQEPHTISRLVGSPPGYVGSDEEGQFTRQLRRRPASVVLLDEIEKAHPDIWDLFLQVFDDGRLTDAQGRHIDCRHALFVMTSNLGADLWSRPAARVGFAGGGDLRKPVREEVEGRLRERFRPEFLNRLDEIVIFEPLDEAALVDVVRLQVARIAERLGDQGVELVMTDAALHALATSGRDPAFGARPIERAVEDRLARRVSELLLSGELRAGQRLRVDVAGSDWRFEHGEDVG